ncbi:3-isopropylmalate dehydratase small subunit [Desulfuribacillus stibiiarsenatis]|uniref:3-isopropylmalate dehydratase small subunit n=1 Tax=Desulfuribacillus stibiiarsenatis TaxID=1390249 RepID=A0A1E5L2U3_9FIRM|nr:3-isopropylmalate dehydratase small subunit [Desulfuribacillus stibiiarsenatis]OEH84406.1 3-isopropylmalate dehydratase small subunit [Desulfuribacillus stibiiarsenatis]
MKLSGKTWKFGNDVDTDLIIPARYLNTSDPKELAKHCMEDADATFAGKVSPGDIMIAGKNFGCGSSREHAPIAIKEVGVTVVIADSFARIFYRNSINIGLPILESPEAAKEIQEGDVVEVDLDKGIIFNQTQNKTYEVAPFPPFIQEIINAGGLVNYVKKKVAQ